MIRIYMNGATGLAVKAVILKMNLNFVPSNSWMMSNGLLNRWFMQWERSFNFLCVS